MIKTKNKHWYLVADGDKAKILTLADQSIQVIHEVKSPFKNIPSKNMATDKDGNFYAGRHHSKGNSAALHEQAEVNFINSLSDLLEKQVSSGNCNKLTLIMPPKAMGTMRKSLSKNTHAVIKQEVVKDLTYVPDNELLDKLSHYI